ncbi:hypothetical protein AMJ80_02845 [bacterium SM23_31]|nr:MAG: hypothetical protein AMJ80_02845 [bacterium SM23_31]
MYILFTGAGFFLTVLYAIFVLSLYTGLRRLKPGKNRKRFKVSIVVAARNEEKNIKACLEALLSQDYPGGLLDIIIVNDRSTDATPTIVEDYHLRHSHITLIDVQDVPENYAPKKYALTQGIRSASGEIICTTDADCVPPPTWVSEMITYFEDDVGFAAGFSPLYVKNHKKGIISDFLYMDSIGLATASAGGIGWGTGWTCAGRNLAYRKSVFKEVGGFEDVKHIISGDDDLLMLLILKKTKWRLRYAIGEKAAVPSYDDTDFRRFANQRARHSSKFFTYPAHVKIAAMAIFLFYLAFLFYPVYMLAAWQFLTVYLVMAGSKFLLELLATGKGARTFGAKFTITAFVKAYFIHPVVIVLFALLGASGKFTWKGREF